MFIKRILAKEFTRLSHSNIQSLEVSFDSKFQLILGTNGSGKSSIAQELLTGYPASPKDFGPNGLHELEVEHRGSTYILRADYSINKYAFIKDGEVIHDNCTASMQKGLVEQYFGIDNLLADIISDKLKFTEMSTQQRRQIIMRASGINIDLGMDILDKFKERANYYKQYNKNLSKRLVDEDNNLPADSHLEELEKRRDDIIHDLGILDEMSVQPKQIGNEQEIIYRIFDINNRASRDALVYLDTPEALFSAFDRDGALEIITRLKYQVEELERSKTERYKEIEDLRISLGKSTFSNISLEDLTKEKENLHKEMEVLDQNAKGFIYKLDGVKQAVESSTTLYEELREIFIHLPDNSEGYFTRDKRSANTEAILSLGNRIGILNRNVHELEHELKLHKTGDKIGCPSCLHEFIPGVKYSESQLQADLKKCLEELATLEMMLKEEKEYQVEVVEYQNKLSSLEHLYRHHHLHQNLIDALKGYSYVTNNPKHCLSIVEDWITDIGVSMRYRELSDRLIKVEQDIILLQSEDLERRRLGEERLNDLSKTYSTYIDQSVRIRELIQDAEAYIRHIDTRSTWIGETENVLNEVEEYNEANLNNMVHRFVYSSKAELSAELTSIEKQITGIQYTKLNRDRLLKEKEEVDENIENMTILYDELCPKTGMLGDALDEFIGEFVDKLNAVINAVWTYPIEVQPCRNKKGDLDFYFPVKIKGAKEPSDDIKNTSTAQRDIINFAFKLLIMKTHDLGDFPLVLDELAANMDDVHRVRMMKVVYDMIETEMSPQMFMISHYAAQHGTFTNAQVLVVNADNLQTIPDGYNSHAKFS